MRTDDQAPGVGKLKQGVTLIDLVMLGAGTAIGAAIFSVLGPAAQVGGNGILIAVGIAAIPMALFGLVYAYMASALPRTAASFEWQREFSHPLIAFAIVWMRILANAVVMIILAKVLVNYLGMVLPLPAKPAMAGFFLVIFALNYFGVAIAARAQTVLMLLLLAVFALFVISGAPQFKPGLLIAAIQGGWAPIALVLPLMIQLFLGIETATEVGEEVKDSARVVPIGIALALALTVLVYGLVAFTALSLAGAPTLAASKAPLLAAAKISLGPWATPVIVIAAALALTKSMNAVFMVFARFLYAMGRAGVLPESLGHVHPRFGTPDVATIVALGVTMAGLLLPDSLLFLLLAVNVPTMMKYFGSCLAAYNVARLHPEVHAKARLRFSKRTVIALSLAGMIASAGIAAAGLGTDMRPYLLLGAWLSVGLVYYAIRTRSPPD